MGVVAGAGAGARAGDLLLEELLANLDKVVHVAMLSISSRNGRICAATRGELRHRKTLVDG